MGYYTYLSIEIDREEPTVEQVAEAVADVAKDTDVAFWRSALTGQRRRSSGTSAHPT